MQFFLRDDAPTLFESGMVTEHSYPSALADFLSQFDFSKAFAGAEARVLFRQAWDGGFSLVQVRFGADYILYRHHHDTDCTYYVTRGEVRLGRSRILRAGDGFFVPAHHSYSYTAGPEGVEILEFRHASTISTYVVEDSEAIWKEIFRVADTHQETWAAARAAAGKAPASDEAIWWAEPAELGNNG